MSRGVFGRDLKVFESGFVGRPRKKSPWFLEVVHSLPPMGTHERWFRWWTDDKGNRVRQLGPKVSPTPSLPAGLTVLVNKTPAVRELVLPAPKPEDRR